MQPRIITPLLDLKVSRMGTRSKLENKGGQETQKEEVTSLLRACLFQIHQGESAIELYSSEGQAKLERRQS